MGRLTKRVEAGEAVYYLYGFGAFDEVEALAECVDRLAAYEDTGITPEYIASALKTLDMFADATKGVPLNRIRELVEAEKDGRLVVLPCKVGDKIFHLFYGEIQNLLVSSVIYRGHGGYSTNFLVECIPFHRFYWREEIGKTVFLTREEAEAALKKREESTDD